MSSQAQLVEQEVLSLNVGFDVGIERSGLLGLASEFLEAKNSCPLMVCYYHQAERAMMIMSRSTDGPADEYRSSVELMALWPAFKNCYDVVFLYRSPLVELSDGTSSPAIVIIVIQIAGAEAMVYPYSLEDGKISFDMNAELKTDTRSYPVHIGHVFAVNAIQYRPIGHPKEICEWLFSKGHEVQFFGDWSINNVDPRFNNFSKVSS